MMKAIKNFMNKPITWGSYFRICGTVTGLYAAIIGLYVAWTKWQDYKWWKDISKAKKADETEDEI